MSESVPVIHQALQQFAADVTARFSLAQAGGEPEEQLRGPFENFLRALREPFRLGLISEGEVRVERLGKPDFAIHCEGFLAGYVELKASGKGARPERYTGHDKRQWQRFKDLPNLIYCDGNEWALYRNGDLVRDVVRLYGDVMADGPRAVIEEDAHRLEPMLRDFLAWEPAIPSTAPELAELLAPLCRLLRDEVSEALSAGYSPLQDLAGEWRAMLFPDADDAKFADAYAQTVTFALLLARSEGAGTLDLHEAITALRAGHSMLSRALAVLTDEAAQGEISASLRLIQRVVNRIPERSMRNGGHDPWLYFYEDFLTAYDPVLRKSAGAYYTPVEVVQAQVRLVDKLLTERFGKVLGFADPGVITLDPALGTGTYLLGIIKHALERMGAEQGPGALGGNATSLAERLYGFEYMVGPYAVAQLRLTRAIEERGGTLPAEGFRVFLTDTLESPFIEPERPPLYYRIVADQHAKALEVKDDTPVLVCVGNPPYGRHPAADMIGRGRAGGWVRFGDEEEDAPPAIFDAFTEPARLAGQGIHLKNIYNFYVYFWRWALWKVFEHQTAHGPGVVSFITASSYLDGPGFVGMREHLRRECEEMWIIDLGGNNRGSRPEENVFVIETPVAIALAVRFGPVDRERPATVRYVRIHGSREEKLAELGRIQGFDDLVWQDCPEGWQASLKPEGEGGFFNWPLVMDVLPWQHSGVQFKRTWPIGPCRRMLQERWSRIASSDDKAILFRESRDRKVTSSYPSLLDRRELRPLASLTEQSPVPVITQYGYRSFDRQHIIADARVGDYLRPVFWEAYSHKQFYLTSILSTTLGSGPALTASANIPDLHHFCGRGAKDTIPIYRDSSATNPNILPGLLGLLTVTYSMDVSPEDFISYAYGVLAHSGYTARFRAELEHREVRLPLTREPGLFARARDVGRRLIWLHTYGQRMVPEGETPGWVPPGQARCLQAVPETPDAYPETFTYEAEDKTLAVGAGLFGPVESEVFEFEVSGFKVVKSWLGYRMKAGAGKKSSPLDDIRPERWTAQFTTELLELIWVLEATLAEYPAMDELLAEIVDGDLFNADELPPVPPEARKAPTPEPAQVQHGLPL